MNPLEYTYVKMYLQYIKIYTTKEEKITGTKIKMGHTQK